MKELPLSAVGHGTHGRTAVTHGRTATHRRVARHRAAGKSTLSFQSIVFCFAFEELPFAIVQVSLDIAQFPFVFIQRIFLLQ